MTVFQEASGSGSSPRLTAMSSEVRPDSLATTAASDREARQKQQLAEALAEVKRLEERAQVANQERLRCLEATRQLKGSIRIMGRIRPPVEGEVASHVLQPLSSQQLQVLTEPRALLTERRSQRSGRCQSLTGLDEVEAMDSRVFLFDDLFDGEATDDEIFSSIQDELDAAVAGEAVCILAYGATGSGKTHTVTQLAQRAAGELERQALAMSSGGIKLEITVQLVEIYNDQLRDLLAEGAQPRLRVSVSSSGSALLGAVSQCISSDSAGGIAKMLGQVLRTGQAHRATFNTALNVRSSRSHLVMMLFLGTRDVHTGQLRTAGKLSFVDLAGSERLKRSEAVGERRREAQHINRSLSALADVISAKERRVTHVPFRNSKLTQLLQDALGGSGLCRTLVIVTLPPTRENLNDTLHSLQFSQRLTAIALPPVAAFPPRTSRDGSSAWHRAQSAAAEDRQLMLEVSHWRQEFEKAQAQREEFRMALEEKDRELQEERRRNSELLAEARRQETTRAASPAAKGAERASRPATAAQPSRMTTREAPREAPRDGSKPGAVARRPSPVLRSSRSAEPVPSREAAGRGALPSRTARGASPTERVRLKMAPAENSGTYTSERPVRPSWAAPLQELHEKAPVATPAVRETPKTPQTVPRVMPPRREASPGGASGGRSGSPPRPIMSPGRVPVFAMSPRAAGALAWPDGGSPSSPEAPRAKADHERHRSGGSRSVSLGRRGPVPQNYCVEVISDVQASKLTGRPVEEERPRKCPPSPALLLCPTEVIDDHEEIGDGTLWVAAELSDVSASSDEHQIRERLQRCLGLHESQARRGRGGAKAQTRSSPEPRVDPMSKTVPAVPAWSGVRGQRDRAGRDTSRTRTARSTRYAPVLSQRSFGR